MERDFGESGRFEPDEARRFIQDLTMHMSRRAHSLANDESCEMVEAPHRNPDSDEQQAPSPQKQLYGDAWRLLYGITQGMDYMKSGSERQYSPGGANLWEIDDSEWQEHYDEYGYGEYGRGLEIGKKLAFYEGHSFTFSAETDDESPDAESQEMQSSDSEFTFTDYSDG